MNGLIVVNKPINMTSRDVVNVLTSLFGLKKIGHTGTLDPIATGVLVCLVGRYTKLGDLITAYDKEYIAEIKLGVKTDTGDITGNIIEQKDFKITEEKIKEVFKSYLKTYEQTVPKYSAVKIKGKKLYEYARNDENIKLPTRMVTIYYLELLSYTKDTIKFKTKVSKGTYIRSLIEDLCASLDTVGTMQSLVRTKQGKFDLEDAYSLEEIKVGKYRMQNVKEFLDYPVVELDNDTFLKVDNGMTIENIWHIKDKVIFTYQNKDIAIYENKNNILKSYVKL